MMGEMPGYEIESPVVKVSHLLDENLLEVIHKQPGVLTVIAFDEGFTVKSIGDGEFEEEQVAAIAEDFLRAAAKITSDMMMGALHQITLEGREKKCIIAPYGDLSLCLLTTSDANLGLIRLAIRNLQNLEVCVNIDSKEVKGGNYGG